MSGVNFVDVGGAELAIDSKVQIIGSIDLLTVTRGGLMAQLTVMDPSGQNKTKLTMQLPLTALKAFAPAVPQE